MPSLNPSAEQLKRFAERMPAGEPILMLNLLRFNQQAAIRPTATKPHAAARKPTHAIAARPYARCGRREAMFRWRPPYRWH